MSVIFVTSFLFSFILVFFPNSLFLSILISYDCFSFHLILSPFISFSTDFYISLFFSHVSRRQSYFCLNTEPFSFCLRWYAKQMELTWIFNLQLEAWISLPSIMQKPQNTQKLIHNIWWSPYMHENKATFKGTVYCGMSPHYL